jgi:hypothetical protein
LNNNNKIFDITQILNQQKIINNIEPTDDISINDADIISFLKVAALIRTFSLSDMADIQLTDEDLIIKVNNYLEHEIMDNTEKGTNLQIISAMTFYPPNEEDQISDEQAIADFKQLLLTLKPEEIVIEEQE